MSLKDFLVLTLALLLVPVPAQAGFWGFGEEENSQIVEEQRENTEDESFFSGWSRVKPENEKNEAIEDSKPVQTKDETKLSPATAREVEEIVVSSETPSELPFFDMAPQQIEIAQENDQVFFNSAAEYEQRYKKEQETLSAQSASQHIQQKVPASEKTIEELLNETVSENPSEHEQKQPIQQSQNVDALLGYNEEKPTENNGVIETLDQDSLSDKLLSEQQEVTETLSEALPKERPSSKEASSQDTLPQEVLVVSPDAELFEQTENETESEQKEILSMTKDVSEKPSVEFEAEDILNTESNQDKLEKNVDGLLAFEGNEVLPKEQIVTAPQEKDPEKVETQETGLVKEAEVNSELQPQPQGLSVIEEDSTNNNNLIKEAEQSIAREVQPEIQVEEPQLSQKEKVVTDVEPSVQIEEQEKEQAERSKIPETKEQEMSDILVEAPFEEKEPVKGTKAVEAPKQELDEATVAKELERAKVVLNGKGGAETDKMILKDAVVIDDKGPLSKEQPEPLSEEKEVIVAKEPETQEDASGWKVLKPGDVAKKVVAEKEEIKEDKEALTSFEEDRYADLKGMQCGDELTSSLMQKIMYLESEKENLRKKILMTPEGVLGKINQCTGAIKELESLKKEYAALKEENKTLRQDLTAAKRLEAAEKEYLRKIEDSEAEVEVLKISVSELMDKVSDLEAQLRAVEEEKEKERKEKEALSNAPENPPLAPPELQDEVQGAEQEDKMETDITADE